MLRLNHYQGKSKAELLAIAKQYGVYSLLGKIGANPKVDKNGKLNVLTLPLHLAPHNLSGHNVCASATAGCIKACLHTAGNPAYMHQKQASRIARTKLFFANRSLFIEILRREIKAMLKSADRLSMRPAIRLNATSDIRWESVAYDLGDGKKRTLFSEFPQVQFYDYTKHHNRKNIPANYHLTFSLAENNHEQAMKAYNNGLNVAAVFDTKRGQSLPGEYAFLGNVSLPVHDGDFTDYRPLDKRGIIGLRAKGDAIGDKSGFVQYVSA